MIRTFVGVRIDPKMAQKISEVQTQLKQSLTGIRWVVRENLHFTLKFLGSIKGEKVAPIIDALEQPLRAIPSFPINSRGIGVFPDIRRARVLWAGLEGNGLEQLAVEVEMALESFGFAREKRAFKPHLTIGRWRNFPTQSERLKQEIAHWKDYNFGEFLVQEVVFFQSILKPDGAVYSPLRLISLGDKAN